MPLFLLGTQGPKRSTQLARTTTERPYGQNGVHTNTLSRTSMLWCHIATLDQCYCSQNFIMKPSSNNRHTLNWQAQQSPFFNETRWEFWGLSALFSITEYYIKTSVCCPRHKIDLIRTLWMVEVLKSNWRNRPSAVQSRILRENSDKIIVLFV